ncbi:hypothetical protein DFP72DRAFT_856050 [Ephemerocybe angulata]|uniref:Uncharacterized protein n=1 Tax=Ephemerocybe angulata TaxID=980116 RepID=A0A8H6LWX3_9AGAR|nr:hypothetical protein DFP72DRAFT_856050 [Tulosesus angulatus]
MAHEYWTEMLRFADRKRALVIRETKLCRYLDCLTTPQAIMSSTLPPDPTGVPQNVGREDDPKEVGDIDDHGEPIEDEEEREMVFTFMARNEMNPRESCDVVQIVPWITAWETTCLNTVALDPNMAMPIKNKLFDISRKIDELLPENFLPDPACLPLDKAVIEHLNILCEKEVQMTYSSPQLDEQGIHCPSSATGTSPPMPPTRPLAVRQRHNQQISPPKPSAPSASGSDRPPEGEGACPFSSPWPHSFSGGGASARQKAKAPAHSPPLGPTPSQGGGASARQKAKAPAHSPPLGPTPSQGGGASARQKAKAPAHSPPLGPTPSRGGASDRQKGKAPADRPGLLVPTPSQGGGDKASQSKLSPKLSAPLKPVSSSSAMPPGFSEPSLSSSAIPPPGLSKSFSSSSAKPSRLKSLSQAKSSPVPSRSPSPPPLPPKSPSRLPSSSRNKQPAVSQPEVRPPKVYSPRLVQILAGIIWAILQDEFRVMLIGIFQEEHRKTMEGRVSNQCAPDYKFLNIRMTKDKPATLGGHIKCSARHELDPQVPCGRFRDIFFDGFGTMINKVGGDIMLSGSNIAQAWIKGKLSQHHIDLQHILDDIDGDASI